MNQQTSLEGTTLYKWPTAKMGTWSGNSLPAKIWKGCVSHKMTQVLLRLLNACVLKQKTPMVNLERFLPSWLHVFETKLPHDFTIMNPALLFDCMYNCITTWYWCTSLQISTGWRPSFDCLLLVHLFKQLSQETVAPSCIIYHKLSSLTIDMQCTGLFHTRLLLFQSR